MSYGEYKKKRKRIHKTKEELLHIENIWKCFQNNIKMLKYIFSRKDVFMQSHEQRNRATQEVTLRIFFSMTLWKNVLVCKTNEPKRTIWKRCHVEKSLVLVQSRQFVSNQNNEHYRLSGPFHWSLIRVILLMCLCCRANKNIVSKNVSRENKFKQI